MKRLKQSATAKTIAAITIAVVVILVLILPVAMNIYIISDIFSMGICAILAAFSFIFLIYSAGHVKGSDEIVPRIRDKIPFDVFMVGVAIITAILVSIIFSINIYSIFALACMLVAFSALVLVGISVCTTIAIRIKLHNLFQNTVTAIILKAVTSIAKKITSAVRDIFENLPLVWKYIGFFIILYSIELWIFAASAYTNIELYYFFRCLEQITLVVVVLTSVISFKRILIAGQKLADGKIDYKMDTNNMFSVLKKHGQNLNNISSSISVAVEEQMKSERFKTELITNVSHDIKTPLTSIINYVDLIKKEELENPKVQEYVAVLDRQSAKLKKLIEDLVEASKASTGNITVNAEKTALGVLLAQTVGEYEEKAEQAGLALVLTIPEQDIYIYADGRLMWRVFDNLLSNICKYTLGATRVYMDLEQIEDKAVVTFRNISKYPLNITSEELMERFVRGDSSRHTEGSGLGLSIAKSLAELQGGGKFNLYIDGDLFKVIMTFDVM